MKYVKVAKQSKVVHAVGSYEVGMTACGMGISKWKIIQDKIPLGKTLCKWCEYAMFKPRMEFLES